MNTLEK